MNSCENIILVVGIDGSGKTTFLNNLESYYDYKVIEPSSSPEMRTFKSNNAASFVDLDLINAREKLFLDLNKKFTDELINASEENIATTGNSLVTVASHGLMRAIVGRSDHPPKINQIVDTWKNSGEIIPKRSVFIHAPGSVILGRIHERQLQGDSNEDFWGFNSPHFLLNYQKFWREIITYLHDEKISEVLTLDSSKLTPAEMINTYTKSL